MHRAVSRRSIVSLSTAEPAAPADRRYLMTNQPIRAVLQAKDIQNLVTAAPDATVAEVAAQMTQRGVGAVIIRGSGSEIGGIFTERDVMCRVVADGRDPARTRVSEVMSPN